METKVCTTCKEELPATSEYFQRQKGGKYGFRSRCKECIKQIYEENKEKINAQYKKYYDGNKEQILEKQKQYYEENKDHYSQYYEENKEKFSEKNKLYYKENKKGIIEYRKQYYENNKEKVLGKAKQYREENKEQISERQKQYYKENKEQAIEYQKQYREENKEQLLEKAYKYIRKRLKKDIGFKILRNCRTRLYLAIKGINKSASTKELIGCSIEHLLEHLENQFQEDMSWDNYGEWHIDHIKPCALFDFTKEEEQRECFNYTNLQPLWAEDNLRKGAKYMEGTK